MSEKVMPLEGVKVVDLSTIVAAPTAAELLCTFGADVIKVEAPIGDGQRDTYRFLQTDGDWDCGPIYSVQNANKEHIVIDLKNEQGHDVMLKLLSQADIFVTNVRPKSLAKLGLDYETLKDSMPKLIYAHFSGYGTNGPDKDAPGFDSTVFWWRSGMMADWNIEGVPFPFKPTYAFGDTVTASSFFSAILLALLGREKTGQGTRVDCSLYASGIWCNGQGVVQTQFKKKHLNPDPTDPDVDPMNYFYLCGDGKWFTLNSLSDYAKDFAVAVKVLGIEDVLDEVAGMSRPEILKTGKAFEIRKRFIDAFAGKPAAYWREAFLEAGLPCEYAHDTCDIATDEQALANDYLEEVEFPGGYKAMMPVAPMFLSEFGRRPIKPAGKMGEDTEEILKAAGYDEATIAALKDSGAVK